MATVGAADWGDDRLCGGRVVRPVRCEPDPGRSLGWPAGQRLAGAGPELWSRLLVHPARLYQAIFPDYLSGTWAVLLGNGITAGGLTVVGLTLFLELTGPRRRRLEIELGVAGLPELTEFLRKLAARLRWSGEATQRLCLIGEEALTSLIQQMDAKTAEHATPRLRVLARQDGAAVELEFMAAVGEDNLEDHIALLGDQVETPDEREFSLRLLRHFASSVRHQQYHNIDIVTVRVDGAD